MVSTLENSIVITGFSGEDGRFDGTTYTEIIKKSKELAERHGYRFHLFNIELKESEKTFGRDKRYHWKPRVLRKALNMADLVIWLDGDALIVKPFDLPENFDLGLCIRDKKKRKRYGPINTGAIFARNKDNLEEFFNEWLQRQEKIPTDCDQHHLNRMILDRYKLRDLEAGKLIDICGAKVRLFHCSKYNSWMWERWKCFGGNEDPYILHFKRARRPKFKEWLQLTGEQEA